MKSIVIFGCGGMGREILHLCRQDYIHVSGFLDERPEMKNKIINDLPVLGDVSDILCVKDEVVICCTGIGNPFVRKRIAEKIVQYKFNFSKPVIHSSINISKYNSIQLDSLICENSILTVNINIGQHVLINRSVNIGHDVNIGDYASIMPGSIISGCVNIGQGVTIGAGAVIKENVNIGDWATIGAGAFVKDNVPPDVLFAGVPAVFKKKYWNLA